MRFSCFFSNCYYAFYNSNYSNFSIQLSPRSFSFFVMNLFLILLFLSFLIFVSRNLLLMLLLLEILGFFVIFFVSFTTTSFVSRDYLVLLVFSILVIEGVIALCGLIMLVRYSGRDYLNSRSLVK